MGRKLSDIYWQFAVIWYLVGIAANVFFISRAIGDREWNWLVPVAVWLLVTLTVRAARKKIEKVRKEKELKRSREYREENIEEITVEDERFGRIVFDFDKKTGLMEAEDYTLEKPLGRHKLIFNTEIEGRDHSKITDALGYVYDHHKEILEKMYIYTVEACRDYEEKDKNGKPYDLSYVRKNLDISYLYVFDYDNEVYVNLTGSICGDDGNDLLGCHSVTAGIKLLMGEEITVQEIITGLEG